MKVSSFWQCIPNSTRLFWLGLVLGLGFISPLAVGADETVRTAPEHLDLEQLDLEQLIDNVDGFLIQHFASLSNTSGARIETSVKKLDSRLNISACSSPLSFELRDTGTPGGNVSIHTRCQGDKPWAVYIPAEVKVLQPVIIASRNIERGIGLEHSDFDSEWRDVSALSGGFVTDSSRLLGKFSSRRIRSGEAIRLSSLSEPIAVKRGDAMVVEAQAGSIMVSTQAIALSNGRVGEQISARNSQSERVVRVKIIGPGRGKVIL